MAMKIAWRGGRLAEIWKCLSVDRYVEITYRANPSFARNAAYKQRVCSEMGSGLSPLQEQKSRNLRWAEE
jgi:hypothetical protein